jgi:hypothetical protein
MSADYLPLFDRREPSIDDRFRAFHALHPEVLAALVGLVWAVPAKGPRVGIKALWERLRWEFSIERDEAEAWKLNNDYHALYARALMQEYPEFAGFFEVRRLKAV